MQTLQKRSLFWDVKDVDPQMHARFVIERIFNSGDVEDVFWAMKYYGKERIIENLSKSKGLDERSKNFWNIYFNTTIWNQEQSQKKPSLFSNGKDSCKGR